MLVVISEIIDIVYVFEFVDALIIIWRYIVSEPWLVNNKDVNRN